MPAPGKPRPEAPDIHINNVNAYHGQLKEWMRRFHGVATKNLPNYPGRRLALEAWGDQANPQNWILSVLSIVTDLEGDDLNGLRRQWRAQLGGEAPAHLPLWLLMRVLAYRLQSDAFGGLDKSIRRNLRPRRTVAPASASTVAPHRLGRASH